MYVSHCHMLLLYMSLGYLWKWICSYLDEQVTAGRRGPGHRPPLIYWKSGVELFLLEVRIKSTLGVVLRDKMVHYERRIQNICLFNTQTFLNSRSQTKKHRWERTIAYENERRQYPTAPCSYCLTMYPNSILDILAWMMDHSPQRKWDAKAYLQMAKNNSQGLCWADINAK